MAALRASMRSLAPGLTRSLRPGNTRLIAAPSRVPRPGRTRYSTQTTASAAKIAVIYYSTYGHIQKMAEAEVEGAKEVEGVDVTLMQFPEILSEEILAKMHAAPKKADVPVVTVSDLVEYDGFIMGFPTRYGSPAAQFKAFWDATGGLWVKGSLVGKAVATFVGTGSQGGGQETTHLVSLTNFVHHGMIYVPPGYSYGAPMSQVDRAEGGSAYGAGVLAGSDGSRQPSEQELGYARHQDPEQFHCNEQGLCTSKWTPVSC